MAALSADIQNAVDGTAAPQAGSSDPPEPPASQEVSLNAEQRPEVHESPLHSRAFDLFSSVATEISTHLHGSCPRCHHWHNRVQYNFNPRQHNKIMCSRCRHVIFGIGGNSSHESFMSQLTITTGNRRSQQHVPCSNRSPVLTMTMSSRSTGLGPVAEVHPDVSPLNGILRQGNQAEITVRLGADKNLDSMQTPKSAQVDAESRVIGLNEKRFNRSVQNDHAQVRAGSRRGLFKRWKFQFPLKFKLKLRPLVKSRENLRSPGAAIGPPVSGANPAGEILEREASKQLVIDSNQANKDVPHRSSQTPQSATTPTLNDSPDPTRPNTVDKRIDEPRYSTDLPETSASPAELSPRDVKTKRQEAHRQKLTDEANANVCKCSISCHCMQPGSYVANASSSRERTLSETDKHSSEDGSGTASREPVYSNPNYFGDMGGGVSPLPEGSSNSPQSSSSSSGRRNSSHLPPGLGRNGNAAYQHTSLSQMYLVDSEPPPLSDTTSTTIVSSPRSESPGEIDCNCLNYDQASYGEYRTPRQSPGSGDGGRTPTQEYL